MLLTKKMGVVLQLLDSPNSSNFGTPLHPSLSALLDQFKSIFNTPTCLPPIRNQDHHIDLFEETKTNLCLALLVPLFLENII